MSDRPFTAGEKIVPIKSGYRISDHPYVVAEVASDETIVIVDDNREAVEVYASRFRRAEQPAEQPTGQCCYCGKQIIYAVERGQHSDGRVFHGNCYSRYASWDTAIAELEATVQKGCELIYRGKGERNVLEAQLTEAQGKVSQLKDLVKHCWPHSSDKNCFEQLAILRSRLLEVIEGTPTEPREFKCDCCDSGVTTITVVGPAAPSEPVERWFKCAKSGFVVSEQVWRLWGGKLYYHSDFIPCTANGEPLEPKQ